MAICPNCGSDKTRRGGALLWTIYLVLIAFAIPAVVVFQLNAAIVAGIVIALVIAANLILDQRVCLDCGTQWRGNRTR